MIRRLLGCAALTGVVALVCVGLAFWQLRVEKPAMPRLDGQWRTSRVASRTFAFYIPARVRPHPKLLIVLHGAMSNGKQMREATGYAFDELADREGFLVAYPNGFGGHWNDCRAVGDSEARRLAVDDVAFLRTMADWFRREHGVAHVFAMGVSNGGQMAYRLALEAPDLVRGVAVIAANLPAPDNQRCAPSGRPVATMIINGTDDPLNPHLGGPVALFGIFLKRGNVQSTLASATYWAKLAGHPAPPVIDELPDNDPNDGATATRHRWAGEGGPPVTLVVVHGGGHTVPHPVVRAPRLLGRTCHDFSAAREVWEFFAGI